MPAFTIVRTRAAALALPAFVTLTLTTTACDQQDTPPDPFEDAPAAAADDDDGTAAGSHSDDDVQSDTPNTGDQFCWGYEYASSQSRVEVESCSAAADDYIDFYPVWLDDLEQFGTGEAGASCTYNGATNGDGELPDGGAGPMGAGPGGGGWWQQMPKCVQVCASAGKLWDFDAPNYGTCALNLKALQIDAPKKQPATSGGMTCSASQTRWRMGATVQFDCGCRCV